MAFYKSVIHKSSVYKSNPNDVQNTVIRKEIILLGKGATLKKMGEPR